jgi:hypothetical protein
VKTKQGHSGFLPLILNVPVSFSFDAKTETCIDDPEANRLLGRTYRKPFVVPESV